MEKCLMAVVHIYIYIFNGSKNILSFQCSIMRYRNELCEWGIYENCFLGNVIRGAFRKACKGRVEICRWCFKHWVLCWAAPQDELELLGG